LQAHKAAQDTTGERLELSKRRLDLQERVLKARENRPDKIGTMDIPLPAGPGELTGPMLKGVPLDSPLINQVMGTNAPAGTGTNFSARAQSPAAAGNADARRATAAGVLSRRGQSSGTRKPASNI
jgi:hypothetical protein